MRYLTLLLFAPTFAVLAWLYWAFPASMPRTPARRRFDLAALVLSFVLALVALQIAVDYQYSVDAAIWRQIMATAWAYPVFVGVLGIAWVVRASRWR